MKEKIKEDEISMLPNILKETVRGIQPILIEDEMLQHREVFLIEELPV